MPEEFSTKVMTVWKILTNTSGEAGLCEQTFVFASGCYQSYAPTCAGILDDYISKEWICLFLSGHYYLPFAYSEIIKFTLTSFVTLGQSLSNH
jgi:hypothetical protein